MNLKNKILPLILLLTIFLQLSYCDLTIQKNPQVEEYVKQYEQKQNDLTKFTPKNSNGNIQLLGRIFYLKDALDESKLNEIHLSFSKKPYAFAMGGDGLEYLLEKGKDSIFDSMLYIGWTKEWIANKVQQNTHFYLIVMEESKGFQATWDAIDQAVIKDYPQLKIHIDSYDKNYIRSQDIFKSEYFVNKYKDTQTVDNATAESNPDIFLTPTAFEKTEKKPEDYRVFLWKWYGLNNLFAGNGFTQDANGKKGSSEFLIPNQTLKYTIDNFSAKITKLDVKIPEIKKENTNMSTILSIKLFCLFILYTIIL